MSWEEKQAKKGDTQMTICPLPGFYTLDQVTKHCGPFPLLELS